MEIAGEECFKEGACGRGKEYEHPDTKLTFCEVQIKSNEYCLMYYELDASQFSTNDIDFPQERVFYENLDFLESNSSKTATGRLHSVNKREPHAWEGVRHYKVKESESLGREGKSSEELVAMLEKKIALLVRSEASVGARMVSNDVIARDLATQMYSMAGDRQADKFNTHVNEIDSATYLLVGLSGRLAKVEKILETSGTERWSVSSEDTDIEYAERLQEVETLKRKRTKLLEQLEEARWIKECLDKRSLKIESCLEKYLGVEYLHIYRTFLQERIELASEAKELSDKIKLGMEQLKELQQRGETYLIC